MNKILSIGLFATCCVAVTSSAHAESPQDISPANCQPLVPSVDGPLLKFQDGAWEFLSGKTGTARLVCAVPNQFELSLFGPCIAGSFCDFWRVDYRDSDGTGTAAQVTAELFRRRSTGSVASLFPAFNSNHFTATGDTFNFADADDSYEKVPDQTVYLQVTLVRTSTSRTARFSGFQFMGQRL